MCILKKMSRFRLNAILNLKRDDRTRKKVEESNEEVKELNAIIVQSWWP